MQAIVQAMWPDEPSVACLPRVTKDAAATLQKAGFGQLSDAVTALQRRRGKLAAALRSVLQDAAAEDCLAVLQRMPCMEVRCAAPRLRRGTAAPGNGVGGAAEARDGEEEEEREEEVEQYDVAVTLMRQGGAAAVGRGQAGKASKKARVYAPRCVDGGAVCCVLCVSRGDCSCGERGLLHGVFGGTWCGMCVIV